MGILDTVTDRGARDILAAIARLLRIPMRYERATGALELTDSASTRLSEMERRIHKLETEMAGIHQHHHSLADALGVLRCVEPGQPPRITYTAAAKPSAAKRRRGGAAGGAA
jgi:hypothetical protein